MTVELGHGHTLRYFSWDPNREFNPQYEGIPSESKAGAIVDHPHARTGELCSGSITFDTATMQTVFSYQPRWTVESWEPLTLSPSILCTCGDHGFIREGQWVPA